MSTGKITIAEGSDKAIASHSFTEDAETKHVERVAPGTGVLTIPGTAQVAEKTATGTYPASPVSVVGMAGILIKASFSATGISCAYRVQLFDSAGTIISESDEYAIANTEVADGARYVGSAIIIDNRFIGASGIKINLTTAPASGNVSFFVSGV